MNIFGFDLSEAGAAGVRSALAIAFLGTGAASASAETLSVSPIPDGVESRFCYYAGLAYSESASLTLNVPLRREATDASQLREFVCSRDDASGNLVWVGVDLERRGLSGN